MRLQVLDCECVRQCIAAGAFAPHIREPYPKPLCTAARLLSHAPPVQHLAAAAISPRARDAPVGAGRLTPTRKDGPAGRQAQPLASVARARRLPSRKVHWLASMQAPDPSGQRGFFRWSLEGGRFSAGALAAPALSMVHRPRLQFSPASQRQVCWQ